MTDVSSGNVPTGLCCVCGVSMRANKVNTCAQCLQSKYDVTEDFAKNGVLLQCKGCKRFAKDTQGWISCEPESKTLLALCLKKIKGLQKVSLIDACFIWTEEHSKRIKLKLIVQKEVVNDVILQQSCVVEFTVQGKMCEDCHLEEANIGSYTSIVQVRQKVDHKRTFLYLEQAILKHGLDKRTVKIDPMPFGLDFFFAAKNDARRFINFLDSNVCMQYHESKKIISQDIKSNVANYHYTYAVDIVPLCKDDLVCLPRVTAQKLGNVSQILLCTGTSNVIRFVDPTTCQVAELYGMKYWPRPFGALMNSPRLIHYIVLDVQPQEMNLVPRETVQKSQKEAIGSKRKRSRTKHQNISLNASGTNVNANLQLALVEVARESDLGVNDTRYSVLSHLGHLLKTGDSVLGYDLANLNTNDSYLEELKPNTQLPDCILVRKFYPKMRKKKLQRDWKLKSLVQFGDRPGFGMSTNEKLDTLEKDREDFLRELEEDPELRSKVNLYKANNPPNTKKQNQDDDSDDDDSDIEDDAPMVNIEELLDDMQIDNNASDEDDDEDDFDSTGSL